MSLGTAVMMSENRMKHRISVVMVTYQTGPVLMEAVNSVIMQNSDVLFELIIVDNGNPENLIKRIQNKRNPNIKILSGHGNIGFAGGANKGAQYAKGNIFIFLNPDCCLNSNVFELILKEVSRLNKDWLLGCTVLNLDGTEQRGSRRHLLEPSPDFVTKIVNRLDKTQEPLPKNTTIMPAISGSCMIMPKGTFDLMSGFDEGFFIHFDDLDFCLRLKKLNVPVYYSPNFSVMHYRSTSQVGKIFLLYHKFRSLLVFFWKHFNGPKSIFWFLLLCTGMAVFCAKNVMKRK